MDVNLPVVYRKYSGAITLVVFVSLRLVHNDYSKPKHLFRDNNSTCKSADVTISGYLK